jgi:hypothetical protein
MDNNSISTTTPSNNFLIIIICILLLFTILGINILLLSGNLVENIARYVTPILSGVISNLGFVTGRSLSETSELLSGVAKTTIDIADGTLHSVGDLLERSTEINPTEQYSNMLLDQSINKSIYTKGGIEQPDSALANIQNPLSIQKSRIIDTMDYVSVKDANKCIAGQIYPEHNVCVRIAD